MISKVKSRLQSISPLAWERILFILILIIAVIERLFLFGDVPGGLNQDEAYAGYNAWSLLEEGIDSCGDSFPVYFEAWGSGMNVLESYLMIPFIALLGLKVWVIRLPQLIIGLLTLPAVYGIVRILWNRRYALLVMFLIAVIPWHIMLCRWGLESNLTPGFVTFGLYFFLRGLEKPYFLIISALMYGLSLYCYATIWPFVPMIILLEVIYCIYRRRLHINRDLIISAVLLCIVALPLVMFLLVNRNLIPEIQTPWFSIPRISTLRDSEISFSNLGVNLHALYEVLILQTDYSIWNTPGDGSGMYYPISIPLMIITFIYYVYQSVRSIRKQTFSPEIIIFIHLMAGTLLGIMIFPCVNRINIIWIPIMIMIGTGICSLLQLLSSPRCRNTLLVLLCGVYLVCLLRFDNYYFRSYMDTARDEFYVGYGDALAAADIIADETGKEIYIHGGTPYSLTLFYEQIPASSYLTESTTGTSIEEFGRYHIFLNSDIVEGDEIYILDNSTDEELFSPEEYERTRYGTYELAIKRQ